MRNVASKIGNNYENKKALFEKIKISNWFACKFILFQKIMFKFKMGVIVTNLINGVK